MKRLCNKIHDWPIPSETTGNMEFFIERLIQSQTVLQGDSF